MQQREEYPAGVPCFVDTGRTDPAAAQAFYGGLFGWEFQDVSPGDDPSYFMATLDGLVVAGMGEQPSQDRAPVWHTYVSVDSADEMVARVAAAGGATTTEPFDVGPAGRMAVFADPQGAEFCVWEPGQTRGAQLVNDPGAWVFSDLRTNDTAAAAAFYGSVFGWKFGPAENDGPAMIGRPGYQDFLTESDPDLPARLEQFGAPEGFGDVVAQVSPVADGEQPNWSVTFSVTDADATASRAVALGGQLVTEPFDAPWVRMAVVRDPDGTQFTASQFVPPEV